MLASRLSLLFLVAACGGKIDLQDGGTNDGGPPPSYDASPPPLDAQPPPPPPPSDGGDCNNVDPGTKTVNVVQMQGSPPPFASLGDTIQPGLYELTAITVYGGGGPSTIVQGQMRVNVSTNGYVFNIGSISGNQAPTHTTLDAQVVSADAMVLTQTCPPSGAPVKANFNAEPTSLALRLYASTLTVDETFAFVGP
jgi:hypothetical protein